MSNIKFKKSLMAVAAGVALAGAGMTAANANSLLFPYFSTQGGASSYLLLRSNNAIVVPATPPTVIGAGASGQQVTANGNVHYVWNIFNGSLTAGGAKTCTHIDAYGWMSKNDVMFQEVSTPVAGITDSSVPALLPPLGATGPVQGFLVVSDVTTANTPGATTAGVAAGTLASGSTATTPTLLGQMIVADPVSGSLFSYSGILGNNFAAATDTLEGDFSNLTGTNFGLSWFPQANAAVAKFSTTYYALAVGNMNANIIAQTSWATTDTGLASAPYNNDEILPYSGTAPVTLGCAASYPVASLMNAAQYTKTGLTGGQLDLKFTNGGAGTGVVLTKIDAVQLGTGVNWTATGAVLFTAENNAAN
jgi:hypothetical protein